VETSVTLDNGSEESEPPVVINSFVELASFGELAINENVVVQVDGIWMDAVTTTRGTRRGVHVLVGGKSIHIFNLNQIRKV